MTLLTRSAVALGLTLLACGPASAQYRPERPYRGIFASGVDGIGQTITASGSVSGGWDDNVYAGAGLTQSPLRARQSGALTQFSGGLNYAMTLERVSIIAGTGTTLRYFPSVDDDVFEAYSARVGGVARLLQKPGLTAHAQAAYQPYTFFSALPPESDSLVEPVTPPEPDFIPVEEQFVSYTAGLDLNHRLTRRWSADAQYEWSTANRLERDFWRQRAGASLGYQLTRNLAIRLGYTLNEGHYDGRITRTHRPELGIDFSRALSLTRNTTIGFGVGTETTVVKDEVRTKYRGVGNFRIEPEIGRSWTVSGVYNRGTRYVETMPEPVFGDFARGSLVGLLTRRLQFQEGVTHSRGETTSESRYDMYSGLLGLSAALNRYMNVGVDYTYYRYRFDEDFALDAGVPRNLDRQSIRGHLTLWAPILNRTRRPNAAR